MPHEYEYIAKSSLSDSVASRNSAYGTKYDPEALEYNKVQLRERSGSTEVPQEQVQRWYK